MIYYREEDIIEYHSANGVRRVRVEYVDGDIKNGRPGFDGVVVDGPEAGTFVWGYDSQILRVVKRHC